MSNLSTSAEVEPKPASVYLKTAVDLKELAKAVDALIYKVDGTLIEMANGQGVGINDQIKNSKIIMAAVNEIAAARKQTVLNVMINKMPPGVESPKHRDWIPATSKQPSKPTVERWHLPVVTNDKAVWWDEVVKKEVHFPVGEWQGPVPYWKYHSVANRGKTARTHIVVDLDTPAPVGSYAEDA